jgi:hypothetical protein
MPNELSGGMARRVALARAIALDPMLIMYDEPFAGLDPISLDVIANMIRRLNDALGATSVVVTYDVAEALKVVDYAYFIDNGVVVAGGTPDELIEFAESLGAPVHPRRAGRPGGLPLPAAALHQRPVGHRVFPLHRLDKPTSGVLLFALDADTAREVGGQFERNEIGKRYLAVVRGWPPEQGVIDHPLSRRFDDYGRKYTPGNEPEPLPALTCFRRLATIELPEAVERYPSTRYALVELEPLHRPPAPVAPAHEAHRPSHHRRRHLGQGHPQPPVPASLRLPALAAGLYPDELAPSAGRSQAGDRGATRGQLCRRSRRLGLERRHPDITIRCRARCETVV